MTKKHYERIAQMLSFYYEDGLMSDNCQYRVVKDLCDFFEEDNKNFRREMFYNRCGLRLDGTRIQS